MRRIFLTGVALLAVACSDVPVPTIPTPPSPTVGAPASLTLSALSGTGNSYGQAFLTARVMDSNGRAVGNARVDFSATDGAFSPTPAQTDSLGQAQTTLSTSKATVTVTAKSGSASSAMEIAINLSPAPLTSPPPIITPAPPPPTPPVVTPPPPPAAFALTLTCTPPSTGLTVPCSVSVAENGAASTGRVQQVSWDWGDGSTTTTTQNPAPPFNAVASTTHGYVGVGPYTVIATVTMQLPDTHTGSAQTSILVK